MDLALPKRYLLSLSPALSHEPSLSLFAALSAREKPFPAVKREAERAWRAPFERVLLPWNFTEHSDLPAIMNFARSRPQKFALQFPLFRLSDLKAVLGALYFEPRLSLEFIASVFHGRPQEELSLEKAWPDLRRLAPSFEITIAAVRGFDLERFVKSAPPALKGKIRAHFPFFHKRHARLFGSQEIYKFLKRHKIAPPERDGANLSIPRGMNLEAEIEPKLHYEARCPAKGRPLISVIIPSRNSQRSLREVLRRLSLQDLNKERFEVIAVDDGSSDGTYGMLLRRDFLKSMNFKYIFYPRPFGARTPFSPGSFRAGAARNLGAKHARGEILLFLDSDILVERSRLSSILPFMERRSLLQFPRYRLKPFASLKKPPSKWRDTLRSPYFERFYARSSEWNHIRLPWKYISTHSLCVRKELFLRAGRFRPSHAFYGFEDTDLGYRLYKMGERLSLMPAPSYHIFRAPDLLPFLKRRSLGLSAAIFFRNTHSLEGYEEFESMIPV